MPLPYESRHTGPVNLPGILRPLRWDWAVDAILTVALAVGTMDAAWRQGRVSDEKVVPGSLLPPPPQVHISAVEPHQLVLAALTALPLVLRRRYPLTTFWAVIA